MTRVERALSLAFGLAQGADDPATLINAMRYSVFPGGARIRPRLCLAVARACGDDQPTLSAAAAASIELLHCASLVHDDLPCFDDAATRRGRPSVHRAFGERIALLAGDALIVLAIQALAQAAEKSPARLGPLVLIISQSVGAPNGIIAGQAWECEPHVALAKYQRAKTGSLFAAATAAGACAGAMTPAHGICWASASARPIRSRTTFATWCRMRRNWASRPAAIRRWDGPMRCTVWG